MFKHILKSKKKNGLKDLAKANKKVTGTIDTYDIYGGKKIKGAPVEFDTDELEAEISRVNSEITALQAYKTQLDAFKAEIDAM